MKAKELLSESNGQLSSVRLQMYVGLVVAAGISGYSVYAHEAVQNLPLIATWLGICTTAKVVQKFAEKGEDK